MKVGIVSLGLAAGSLAHPSFYYSNFRVYSHSNLISDFTFNFKFGLIRCERPCPGPDVHFGPLNQASVFCFRDYFRFIVVAVGNYWSLFDADFGIASFKYLRLSNLRN